MAYRTKEIQDYIWRITMNNINYSYDVIKAIEDSYDHQRMCIERRYQMKRELYTVEGIAVIALLIAFASFGIASTTERKFDEHMKNCNCKTIIEKGK